LQIVVALSCLVAVALARPDGPAPAYGPAYADEPAKYAYAWAVKDDPTYNNYGQNEQRDGYATSGSYYVALPDGRLQRVTYSVNGDGGYVADVTYEGVAQYPEVKPYAAPAPYKPAA
jgi:Insect cuticle protein